MKLEPLFLDLETRSESDLPAVGTYNYAQDESTEIALFAWAIGHDPVEIVDVENGEELPLKLIRALEDEERIKVAHNTNFDRNILKEKLIEIPIEQWEDTMVIAYTLTLPGKLSQVTQALGADLDFQKQSDGARLVRMFCKPQKVTKNQPFRIRDSLTDPEDWERYKSYGKQDVESMRWAYYEMPQWVIGRRGKPSALKELELWHLSEHINDRGLPIDRVLAEKAIVLAETALKRLNRELFTLTNGWVEAHTLRNRVLTWLEKQGVSMGGYTKEDLVDVLKRDDIPPAARRVLQIRQEAGRTSTAKYQKLLDLACKDDYLRGGIQYYGAKRTGRYAGRGFQPHNLSHPEVDNTDVAAESIINETTDLLFEESAMSIAVSCVRSAIKAPPGYMLGVTDLSNIEGRVLPWLAGEAWKLQAFRDFDLGHGADMYKLAYSTSFGVAVADIGKDERQIGKFQELSLGYQGGVGAFYKQAKKFGTNIEDIYYKVIDLATEEMIESAEWMVAWIRENRKDLDEVSDNGIIGADIVKQMWRIANSKIVSYWYTLESMVRQAIENPGSAFSAGIIKAQVREHKLLILLPSKRPLVYHRPKITKDGNIIYMNHDKGKWHPSSLYGGKIAENVTQAVARDVMTYNMPAMDKYYPIIGTVHDEDICLIDTKHGIDGVQDELDSMMSVNPPWAEGLPLSAGGYISHRYKKD